jgi:hypothetical protein
MSDYLSDLVTKNIGTADVIHPRRASRFEPAQAKGALEAPPELFSWQAENLEQENIIEAPPARPRRRREARLNESFEATSSQKDSDGQIVQASPVSPPEIYSPETGQKKTPVTVAPKINDAMREPASRNLSVPNHLLPTLSTFITPAPAPSKSAERQEKSSNIIEPAPVQTPSEPAKTGESKTPLPKNTGQQNLEANAPIIVKPRVEQTENRVRETAVNQTIIPKPREPLSKQISESAKTPEAPVINVTIGRVEVRAVTSPASPKPSHAKPQTLSLDEYLQKRSRGGQR